MRGFPVGFLKSFLGTRKVSCFLGAESHKETRKLSLESLVNIGVSEFPPLETFPRQETFEFPTSFLQGFLSRENRQ